jgi:cysteine desulfuration protein SufE
MDLTDIKALYQKKHNMLLSLFSSCTDPKSIYEKIISLGKLLPTASKEIMQECNLIYGCQSNVYLVSHSTPDGKIIYEVQSDAIISSGLAQLLLFVYNNEKIELTLFCPPVFIQELGLPSALSMGRSNGLASMYKRMQQDAKKIFIKTHANTPS